MGATPEPATVEPRGLRDLYAMALDNATEGCVRETFGALVGHHQAIAAADPEVRAAMQTIAEDETRHAALSWRIARWLEPQLSEDERRRVEAARDAAVFELRAQMEIAPDPALARVAGLPAPRQAVAMADAMARAVWA